MKLNNLIAFAGLLGLASGLNAQETSISPYSSMGIGNLLFDNNIEHAAMGGLSTVPANPYYSSANFFNPAANRNLNVTSFEFGTNTNLSQIDDGFNKSKKSTTYISNVSLAFPIGPKVRAGFGFQPFSTVGYELANIVESEEITYAKSFDGSGGVNSIHAMGSYNISPEFSLGLRANYLFGNIDRVQTLLTQNLALNTDYSYKTELSGFQFTLGGQYTKKIGDKKRLDIGATYTLGANIHANIDDMTTTYTLVNLEPANIDTVQYHRINSDMKLPHSFSIGASLRKDLNWMVGAQVDWAAWKDYELDGQKSENMNNRFRASAGGFWIPNFNSYKSYFDRIAYRFGAFYEQTPIKIEDTTIDKYGLTFGFGLPVGKDRDASMLNISCELGQMGTTKHNAVKENFANLKIGFTINDIWFRKRVID